MFADRAEAGRRLAQDVQRLHLRRPIVLGLPRGGVPVAAEVARALDAPLDVLVVRKLGAPQQPELAMGAIGTGGVQFFDERVIAQMHIRRDEIERVVASERRELERRSAAYRDGRALPDVAGRECVVVDDGIATGSTALAAVEVLRAQGAKRVVLAVPVLPPAAVARLSAHVDDLVYLAAPLDFMTVGQFYEDFGQTTDGEVQRALDRR